MGIEDRPGVCDQARHEFQNSLSRNSKSSGECAMIPLPIINVPLPKVVDPLGGLDNLSIPLDVFFVPPGEMSFGSRWPSNIGNLANEIRNEPGLPRLTAGEEDLMNSALLPLSSEDGHLINMIERPATSQGGGSDSIGASE